MTNIQITQINVFALMKGGRARWKIENETFNTLKNLGYNFEHNYGHGQKYFSTILCLLMLLAFFNRSGSRDSMSSISGCEKKSWIFSSSLGRYEIFIQICRDRILGIPVPIYDQR